MLSQFSNTLNMLHRKFSVRCEDFICRKATLLLIALFSLFFTLKSYPVNTQKCDLLIKSGVVAMQHNLHTKSLRLLTQAREIAQNNHWHKQKFLAINNIGANYYSLLEYGEALNYYLEAYTIALNNLEPKYEMIVLNNIAILYSRQNKYSKANEYFTKAYRLAKANNSTIQTGIYAINLGNVANSLKKVSVARNYFNEAVLLLKNEKQLLALSKIGLAECDLLDGNTKQARKIAEDVYNNTDNLEYSDIGIQILTIITKTYLKEDNFLQSELFINKILSKKPNLEAKVDVFKMLSELNFKKKQYHLALQYKDSIINANIKLEEIKNGKLFENNKVKFEVQNYKNEISNNKIQIASQQKLIYATLLVICSIILFVFWFFYSLSIKQKQKKLIAQHNEQILELELEKEKKDSLLLEKQFKEKEAIGLFEQERLKNELEQRNRKLSSKALYLSGRNQMIEEILSKLSLVPQLSIDKTITNQILSLKNHLKTDNEWDNFITHFEEINQSFLANLQSKHAVLNSNDIRYLCYIYMNLSTKEIASMLNVTPETCRKRKERIISKLELNTRVNLYDYLISL